MKTLNYREAGKIFEGYGYHLIYRKDAIYAMEKINLALPVGERKSPTQVKTEAIHLGHRNNQDYEAVDLAENFEGVLARGEKPVMYSIEIVSPSSPLAQRALEVVEKVAIASWVILFGGDRWYPVEYVAIAKEDDTIVGLASLAPTDEMGKIGPHIIGAWVEKSHRRQGIATQLVQALARKSLNMYGVEPTIIAVTLDGQHLVESFTPSVPVHIIKVGGVSNLE